MGQNSEPAGYDQFYVIGIHADGSPCGARITMLKDSIVSAAMDMNCRVLMRQPDAVSTLAMTLPIGYVFGTGKLVKLFIPNITRELHDAITDAVRSASVEHQSSQVEETRYRTIH
jgi:hypothetical protein